MKLDFDIIIITSDEPYSKMWHTQLIYTEFLAKNNQVIFTNPPTKWTLKSLFEIGFKKVKKNGNLIIINYRNRFPAYVKWFNRLNESYNEKLISKQIKQNNCSTVLVWHFDSYRNSFFNHFFDKSLAVTRIYHVIDPYYKNPIDRLLCKIANLVIVTSPRLNKYYSDFSDKLINIEQSLDIELQKKLIHGEVLEPLNIDSNFFVLLGTLSDDIDFDWILNLLENKDFKLVIIGKIVNLIHQKEKSDLVFNHPNVKYLGLLSPKEFYPIIKLANAGLIIYNEERRGRVCSPLKALNYIISGLPVITNIDCEIPELLDHSIYYTETLKDANILIVKALHKELHFNSVKNDQYISSISLEDKIEKIIVKL